MFGAPDKGRQSLSDVNGEIQKVGDKMTETRKGPRERYE